MATQPSFDFDTPIDRRGTASMKWDRYPGRDVIPLWVADMDFRSPPAVIDAIKRRADHGVFGYTDPPRTLIDATVAMLDRDHSWRIEPDWIQWLPGLVTGLNLVCRAIGDPGDDVLTAVPVYPPFLTAPLNQERNVIRVPLTLNGERWAFDFGLLERSITPRTRLLLLCNPHNPVGRVWTRVDLTQIAAIAERHDLVVASDEVHSGLVLDVDKHHVPFASVAPEIAARTITLQSASKTFNLPALGCAYAITSDPKLRARMKRAAAGIVARAGAMGFEATLASYRDGSGWRRALVEYLRANRDWTLKAVRAMPGLTVSPVEATYLAWIDARASGITNPVKFFEDAGVGLYDGAEFGASGFLRLNFACARSLLDEALRRMNNALAQRSASLVPTVPRERGRE